MGALGSGAIGFALGIALGEELGGAPWVALGAAVLLGLFTGIRRAARPWPFLWMVALGALAARTSWPQAAAELFDGQPWEVEARVVSAPERMAGRTHLIVEMERVVRGGQARFAGGQVWLAIQGELQQVLPGDRVIFRARLHAPRGFAELDSPDLARQWAARRVAAVAGLASAAELVRRPGESAPFLRAIARWREQLLAKVGTVLAGDRRALVASLVLGDRGEVSAGLDPGSRIAGVSHVLSVSGLHLALAAALFVVGLRALLATIVPVARRWAVQPMAALCALPATAIYTLLTGAAVATVRSCAASWIWLGGSIVGRPATAFGALGAAALLILGLSPLSLYDPSLQLSFVAALGMALLPHWRQALFGERIRDPQRRWGKRVLYGAVQLSAVSVAALLMTAPIAAYHFGQVPPVGPLANLVVVPLAELWVLPLGLLGCMVSAVLPALAIWLIRGAGWGAAALAQWVYWIASWAPQGRVGAPLFWEALLWYGALLTLAFPQKSARRLALALGIAWATAFGARALWPRSGVTVTFFDVGQGDAALVQLPGAALLVDGGGSFDPRFDPGAQVIVPWLGRQGIRRLDVVVMTHPHPDHADGLASVVAQIPVGEVWTNGASSQLPGVVRLLAVARERGVPVVRPHALTLGAARVKVLQGASVAPGRSENDGSIVLRVEYAGRAVLLTGDVEARAEAQLLQSGANLAADLVKVPHHGSRTSSGEAFVAAVHPHWAVVSVGAENRWHFPAPEVAARWQAIGAQLLRTDRDGAVGFQIDPDGAISVRTAR